MNSKDKSEEIKYRKLIAILNQDGYFEVDWQETDEEINEMRIKVQNELFDKFKVDEIDALLILGITEKRIFISKSIRYLRSIASFFVKKLLDRTDVEYIRDRINVRLEESEVSRLLKKAPFLHGFEHLDRDWIMKLWKNLNQSYCKMIRNYNGSVEDFIIMYNPNIHLLGRIFFHLVENNDREYPFGFLATYSAYISEDGKEKILPLKNAIIEYEYDDHKLQEILSDINIACENSTLMSRFVESGEIFESLRLSEHEAYTFLKEIPIYEEAGITCRVPKWWRSESDALKMSLTIGEQVPTKIGFDSLVDFDAELYLSGDKISPMELEQLLSEVEGLTFIKGKWVEVDHKKLKATLKAYEEAQMFRSSNNMSILEAMRFKLDAEKVLKVNKDLCDIEVTNGEWIESILSRLTQPDSIERISSGTDFNGELRAYQKRGLNWLYFMKGLGLGACLADDMGLGKTIQVIALLNHCKDTKKEKSLIIMPVSLIGNWMSEIKKFAPRLKFCVLHPSENKDLEDDSIIHDDDYDLFITSYGMLSKYEWIKTLKWDTVVLDEAQAIKNPRTMRTRAVKHIDAKYKIAMTGTPIENRLSDLWSLFDFLNMGLLGTSREFTDFTKHLEKSEDDYGKLKQVINPFVLRRLKTDKAIISDLPDKIEMKTYSTLSKKQTVLYNKLVNELKFKMESSVMGIQRRGLILSAIMKFKQICNHPDQYLGQNRYSEKDSGKFERLREICENIYEKRERVIVFTQFKEMTEPLKEYMESIFKHEGLILHGGTPVKKRKELVERFQSKEYVPFMILSIKAGGVGLNLTSANHVIHFDRWWNPSVENQATDRAFRIGQMKNVIVHKFIMKGTIEEKIDMMIEDKIKLSEEIISNNQTNLITEMNNDQLMDLFSLKI